MKNPEIKLENNHIEILADKLDELQRDKNNGRGVDVIKTIVLYLKAGKIDQAKATCFNESDKFSGIDDIKDLLIKKLFFNERHPWELLDDFKKRRKESND